MQQTNRDKYSLQAKEHTYSSWWVYFEWQGCWKELEINGFLLPLGLSSICIRTSPGLVSGKFIDHGYIFKNRNEHKKQVTSLSPAYNKAVSVILVSNAARLLYAHARIKLLGLALCCISATTKELHGPKPSCRECSPGGLPSDQSVYSPSDE